MSLKRVHQFLAEIWQKQGITGITYDDLPVNPNDNPNRRHSIVEYKENNRVKFFYYKKRIQIVIFNLENICNFEPFLEEQT